MSYKVHLTTEGVWKKCVAKDSNACRYNINGRQHNVFNSEKELLEWIEADNKLKYGVIPALVNNSNNVAQAMNAVEESSEYLAQMTSKLLCAGKFKELNEFVSEIVVSTKNGVVNVVDFLGELDRHELDEFKELVDKDASRFFYELEPHINNAKALATQNFSSLRINSETYDAKSNRIKLESLVKGVNANELKRALELLDDEDEIIIRKNKILQDNDEAIRYSGTPGVFHYGPRYKRINSHEVVKCSVCEEGREDECIYLKADKNNSFDNPHLAKKEYFRINSNIVKVSRGIRTFSNALSKFNGSLSRGYQVVKNIVKKMYEKSHQLLIRNDLAMLADEVKSKSKDAVYSLSTDTKDESDRKLKSSIHNVNFAKSNIKAVTSNDFMNIEVYQSLEEKETESQKLDLVRGRNADDVEYGINLMYKERKGELESQIKARRHSELEKERLVAFNSIVSRIPNLKDSIPIINTDFGPRIEGLNKVGSSYRYYGFRFNLTSDNNFSGADKGIADAHLEKFGVIITHTGNTPMPERRAVEIAKALSDWKDSYSDF